MFAIYTTFCGVRVEFFLSALNISTGAEIVVVWKTKSYLEDFAYKSCEVRQIKVNGIQKEF